MNQPLASLIALLITSLAFFPPLLAQGEVGAIEGIVTDPSGIELAGVQVVITQQETGTTRTVMTNEEGRYRARNLPLGKYRISASRPLFKKAEIADQMVGAGTLLQVDLILMA